MSLAIGSRLGPYEIVSALGAGGMGEVYRARDSRLERDVAIKVLPESMVHDREAASRFDREMKTVAALNHPNILAIHDVGVNDGFSYAVMELLEGETLRDRLSRAPLSWVEAVEIAAEIAEGLSAAHAKGIVHRDVKPENVFVTMDARVKVLDFGLARCTLVAAGDTMAVTQPGVLIGTVAYMSPEQARGAPVDPASDIFSLGCVLHEMLVGRRPFDRPTAAETMAAILNDAAPRLTDSGRDMPAGLDALVARCLEKKAHQRFPSGRDLLAGLRAVASRPAGAPPTHSDPIDSLAVLPFVNAGGNPDTAYLSDGITESLINSLSQMPGLRVVPRSKAFRYKGQDVDAKKVGRQLKVRALLTGRVLQRGDTLNVQAELVDVTTESQLWGERFNRTMTDIFTVEEEIASRISEKLRLRLTGRDRERLLKRHTADPAAYQLYLRGRFHWNRRTSDGLKKALEYFQLAVDQDPEYALAYAGLADGYLLLSVFVPKPTLRFAASGKAAALRALAIEPDLSEALAALGLIRWFLEWDGVQAERDLRRATELRPDYWLAHDHYAMVLSAQGKHDAAVREVRCGHDLEPLSLVASHHLAWILIRAGQCAEAIDVCRAAIEMDSTFGMVHYWLGIACGVSRQYDEAIAALQVAQRTLGTTFATLELARAYAASGQRSAAERIVVEMRETFDRDYADPYGFACASAALGDTDAAFEWLERAALDRSSWIASWVNGDPRLDAIGGDPRMDALLARMGLVSSYPSR